MGSPKNITNEVYQEPSADEVARAEAMQTLWKSAHHKGAQYVVVDVADLLLMLEYIAALEGVDPDED